MRQLQVSSTVTAAICATTILGSCIQRFRSSNCSVFIIIVLLIVPISSSVTRRKIGGSNHDKIQQVNVHVQQKQQQKQAQQPRRHNERVLIDSSPRLRLGWPQNERSLSDVSSLPLSSSSLSSSLMLSTVEIELSSKEQRRNGDGVRSSKQTSIHNNMDKAFAMKPSSTTITSSSLIEYIDSLGSITKHFILFYWNSSGILENVSPTRGNWLPTETIATLFAKTQPSTHGTVAMLFNLDAIKHIPWDITPPVPVMVYTIPFNVPNIIADGGYVLVPNAYDRRGVSETAIQQVRERITASSADNTDSLTTTTMTTNLSNSSNNESMSQKNLMHYEGTSAVRAICTFQEYQQRKSIIVWRGREFGLASRKRLISMAESQGISQSATNSTQQKRKHQQQHRQNHNQWLDVAATVSGKEEQLHHEVTKATLIGKQNSSNSASVTEIVVESNRLSRDVMAANYKYQIDIGGISGTSWDGLRWKMCASGSLVFKVNTFSKDWWHDTIYPWVHYVPVKTDLSDLYELYQWAESNPEQAFEIALAGQIACLQTSTKQYAEIVQSGIIRALPPVQSDDIAKEAKRIFQYNLTGIVWESTSQ